MVGREWSSERSSIRPVVNGQVYGWSRAGHERSTERSSLRPVVNGQVYGRERAVKSTAGRERSSLRPVVNGQVYGRERAVKSTAGSESVCKRWKDVNNSTRMIPLVKVDCHSPITVRYCPILDDDAPPRYLCAK